MLDLWSPSSPSPPVLLILLTLPSSRRTCDCVFEGQLLRCISPAILHRWIRLVLRHTVLMYGISSILLLPSVFIRGTPQNTRDYSRRVFYIWLNKKSLPLSVFVWVFKSFVFFPPHLPQCQRTRIPSGEKWHGATTAPCWPTPTALAPCGFSTSWEANSLSSLR